MLLRGFVKEIFSTKNGKEYYRVEIQEGASVNVSVSFCPFKVEVTDDVLVELKAVRYGDSAFISAEIKAILG